MTIFINGGAAYTNSTTVSVTLAVTGSPTQYYMTNKSNCNSGGSWTNMASPVSYVLGTLNAANTVYVKVKDAGGVTSTCANATITHDNIAPTATSISINGGAAWTSNLAATLTLAASGSPSEMYITQTAACASGGSWVTYATSKAWTLLNQDASNTVYVKFRDLALNESTCISASIVHDSAPTLAFTSPAGSYINSSNASSFTIGGTCTPSGQNVQISGATTASALCSNGAWTKTLDLSSVAEGAVTLNADYSNSHGMAAAQQSRGFTKDTVAPTGSISIAGTMGGDGVLYSDSPNVTVNLSSAGAASVYLTQDSLCLSGGNWQAYATSLPWTFATANGTVMLYAKFQDPAGNNSACYSASILIDTSAAAFTVANPTNNFRVNVYNHSYFTLNGTCSDDNQPIVISGIVSASPLCSGGTWSTSLTLYDLPDQAFVFTFDYNDGRGHSAAQISRTVIRDSTYPTVAFTSPSAGAWFNQSNRSAVTVSGTCSENGMPVVLSGAVSVTLTCTANLFSTVVDLSNSPQGNVAITATHSDAAGNLDVEPLWVNVDLVAPTVAVTAPTPGTMITKLDLNNFPLSGTCSEYRKNVVISGSASVTVLCSNYTWKANLDLTSLSDGALTFNVDHTDQANNTTRTTATYTKNSSAPGVSFTSPAPGSWVAQATAGNFTVSGTCGFSGGNVVISGLFSATVTCNNNTWTKTTSLVSPPQGNQGLYITHFDSLGQSANAPLWININTTTVDTTPPNLTLTTLAENAGVALSEIPLAGVCESPNAIAVSYGSGLSGPASIACAQNQYSTMISITGAAGARTLTMTENDWAGNTATIIRHFNYVKKSEIKGQVFAIAKAADGSVYYGGDFSNYSTSHLGGVVRVDATGAKEATFDWKQAFDGNVFAAVELPDGSLVFGGDFTRFRGQRASRIAKVDANGNLDTTFCPQSVTSGADWTVYALAVSGTSIYAGGGFTYINGSPATRLAKLDFSGRVDTSFNTSTGPTGGANNPVRALAVVSGNLYAGGDFTQYRGSAVKSLIKVDGATGALNGSFTTNGANAGVNALLSDGGSLYVGGAFTSYQSSSANGIAKVDLNTGALDTTFSPPALNGFAGSSPSVYGLTTFGGAIYATGRFSSYRGSAANNIARLSTSGVLDTTFSPASGANGLNAQGNSILAVGSDVYVGGSFTSYRGERAVGFAKVSSSGALDTSFNPQTGVAAAGADGAVNTLLSSSSGYMYLSGSFSSYRDGYMAGNILKTDAAGNIDLTFNAQNSSVGFNGPVRALAISDASVFAAGDFTLYGTNPANSIAKLSTAGALDTTFNPLIGANGADAGAQALATDGVSLYIGGDFLNYRGGPANRIAKLDASTGALDTTFSPAGGANGANNSVNALALSGTDLYAGGSFTTYRGAAANNLAKLNALNGNLDTTFNPASGANGTNSPVLALLLNGTDLYAGGTFSSYRGQEANRIAKISTQGVLDSGFNAPVGTDGAVNGLALAGSSLYFVTSGFGYGNNTINRLGKINAATAALDTTFSPTSGPNGLTGILPRQPWLQPVGNAILFDGTNLIIGGAFTRFRDQPANFAVTIDTSGNVVP